MSNAVGVTISRTSAGPLATGGDPGDSVFMVATAERGLPNVAHLITSHSQYRKVFGGANGTIYPDGTRISHGDEIAKEIFNKVAAKMYVVRVVDLANAVQAKVVIPDRFDEEEEETSATSITVHAKGHGTWANHFNIDVAAGTQANTFKLTVRYSASGSSPWTTMETFDNLVWTTASLATVGEQSDYIYIEKGSSTNADPRPAIAAYDLDGTTAGVDDNAPTSTHVIGTDSSGVKTGLKCFRDRRLGRGFIIAPEFDNTLTGHADVRTEMLAQYDTYYHYPLFALAPSTSASSAVSAASTAPAGPCKLFYPNRVVEDELTGALKEISPVGEVLGNGLKVLRSQGGLGQHWAGKMFPMGRIATQTNGQPLVDEAMAEALMAKGVCPIWDRGFGNQVLGDRDWYGASYATWRSGHAAYLWMHIADRVQRALDASVFETVDDVFFSAVESGIYGMLYDMLQNGRAFYGSAPPPGGEADSTIHAFDVKCRRDMMTPTDVANNTPRARVWFKDSLTAQNILVEIAKMNLA